MKEIFLKKGDHSVRIKGLLLCLFAIAFTTQATAGIHYELEDFDKPNLQGGISLVNVDGDTLVKVGLSPDLKLGPIDLGLDINFYSPSDKASDHNLQWVSLRHVGYNYKDRHGFKWGRLRDLTLGYGLLMDDFDTGSGGSSEFVTKKAGFHGYTTLFRTRFDAVWTGEDVKAGRVSYTLFEKTPIFGSPLIIGTTYVTDQDGVNDTSQGGDAIVRAKQDGYAADVALPIGGQLFTLYTEYAKLVDHGDGISFGAKGSVFGQLKYRAEVRHLGEDFVPGYYNQTYQATSFDFATDAPQKKLTGFLAATSVDFLSGHFKAGAMYEHYQDIELGTAALGWQRIGNTVGVINYTVPFQGQGQAIGQADILYITGRSWDYIVHIKRVYQTKSTFTESYSVGVRFNLDKLLPFKI